MTCHQYQHHLHELADGEGPKEDVDIESSNIKAHLLVCEDCRATFESIVKVKAAINTFEAPTLRDDFNTRLQEKLRVQTDDQIKTPLALAASFLLAVLFGAMMLGQFFNVEINVENEASNNYVVELEALGKQANQNTLLAANSSAQVHAYAPCHDPRAYGLCL